MLPQVRKDGVDVGSLAGSAGMRLEKGAAELDMTPAYVRRVVPKIDASRRLTALESRLTALERKVAKLK
jgi:hypothetical protein